MVSAPECGLASLSYSWIFGIILSANIKSLWNSYYLTPAAPKAFFNRFISPPRRLALASSSRLVLFMVPLTPTTEHCSAFRPPLYHPIGMERLDPWSLVVPMSLRGTCMGLVSVTRKGRASWRQKREATDPPLRDGCWWPSLLRFFISAPSSLHL